jgi:16S rRNA (guanine527-N7)-methyltransferase
VAEVDDVLATAQERGLLGPGPVDVQRRHAEALVALVEAATGRPRQVLDIGTGGGLPGLVAALAWPSAAVTLLDARRRAVDFVRVAVEALGLSSRCTVLHGRAETLAHEPGHRERYDLVLARAVGRPATAAELCAGFAAVGGHCAVSERPGGDTWDPVGCGRLGFVPRESIGDGIATVRVLDKVEATPAELPRRRGVPAKRPLF